MSTDNDESKVGYGRPPIHTRYKPGQSGNPKGRPKGKADLALDLIKACNKKMTVVENGRRKTFTKWQVACTQLVNRAATGDARAFRAVEHMLIAMGPCNDPVGPTPEATPPEPKVDWSQLTVDELKQIDAVIEKMEKLQEKTAHTPDMT